jgi:hypothetical protein
MGEAGSSGDAEGLSVMQILSDGTTGSATSSSAHASARSHSRKVTAKEGQGIAPLAKVANDVRECHAGCRLI